MCLKDLELWSSDSIDLYSFIAKQTHSLLRSSELCVMADPRLADSPWA